MIKKETKTEEIVETKYLCDFCGVEVRQTYTFCDVRCCICGRDMCPKHRVDYREPGDYNGGDYTTMICTECNKTSEPYFEKLKILLLNYEEEEEEILQEMKNVCMENVKNKGDNNEF